MWIQLFGDKFGKDSLFVEDIKDQVKFILFAQEENKAPKIEQIQLTDLPPTSIRFSEQTAVNLQPTLNREDDFQKDYARVVGSPVNRNLRMTFIGYYKNIMDIKNIYEYINMYYTALDVMYKIPEAKSLYMGLFYRPWGQTYLIEPQTIEISEAVPRKGIYTLDMSFKIYGYSDLLTKQFKKDKIKQKIDALQKVRNTLNNILKWIDDKISSIEKKFLSIIEWINAIRNYSNIAFQSLDITDALLTSLGVLMNTGFSTISLPYDVFSRFADSWKTLQALKNQFENQWDIITQKYQHIPDLFKNDKDGLELLHSLYESKNNLNNLYYFTNEILKDISLQTNLSVYELPKVSLEIPSFDIELKEFRGTGNEDIYDLPFDNPDAIIVINKLEPPYITPTKINKLNTLYPGKKFYAPKTVNVYNTVKVFKDQEIFLYGIDLALDFDDYNIKYNITSDNKYITYYKWGKGALYQWLYLFFEDDLKLPYQKYGLRDISLDDTPDIIALQVKMLLEQDPRIDEVKDIQVSRKDKKIFIDINEIKYENA